MLCLLDCFIKPGDLIDYFDRFTHHTIEHERIELASRAVEYFAKIFQFPFGILYDMVDRLIEFINYLEPQVPMDIYQIPISGENKTLSYMVSLIAYVLKPPHHHDLEHDGEDNLSESIQGIKASDGEANADTLATNTLSVRGTRKFAKIVTLDFLAFLGRCLEVCQLLFVDALITRSWAFQVSIVCILFVFGLVPFIYASVYPATLKDIVTNPSLAS